MSIISCISLVPFTPDSRSWDFVRASLVLVMIIDMPCITIDQPLSTIFFLFFKDMSADIMNYATHGGVSSTLFAIPGLPPPSAATSSHSSRTRRPK